MVDHQAEKLLEFCFSRSCSCYYTLSNRAHSVKEEFLLQESKVRAYKQTTNAPLDRVRRWVVPIVFVSEIPEVT